MTEDHGSGVVMQRSFQGPPNPAVASMADFGAREMTIMILMMAGLVWLGVFPQPVLDLALPTLNGMGL